jgi:hypothetical protein
LCTGGNPSLVWIFLSDNADTVRSEDDEVEESRESDGSRRGGVVVVAILMLWQCGYWWRGSGYSVGLCTGGNLSLVWIFLSDNADTVRSEDDEVEERAVKVTVAVVAAW